MRSSGPTAETLPGSQNGKIFLNERFLKIVMFHGNSEYYPCDCSISGYEAPTIHRIRGQIGSMSASNPGYWPFVIPANSQSTGNFV